MLHVQMKLWCLTSTKELNVSIQVLIESLLLLEEAWNQLVLTQCHLGKWTTRMPWIWASFLCLLQMSKWCLALLGMMQASCQLMAMLLWPRLSLIVPQTEFPTYVWQQLYNHSSLSSVLCKNIDKCVLSLRVTFVGTCMASNVNFRTMRIKSISKIAHLQKYQPDLWSIKNDPFGT